MELFSLSNCKSTKEIKTLIKSNRKIYKEQILKIKNKEDCEKVLNNVWKDFHYEFKIISYNSCYDNEIYVYCRKHKTTIRRRYSEIVRGALSVCCINDYKSRPIGFGRGSTFTHELFEKLVSEKFPNWIIKTPYTKATDKTKLECCVCGHIITPVIADFIRHKKNNCRECAKIKKENGVPTGKEFNPIENKRRKEIRQRAAEFKKLNPIPKGRNTYKTIYKMTNDYYKAQVAYCRPDDIEDYDLSLVDYKTQNDKIKIICKKHGEFEMLPANFKYGQKCPHCCRKEYLISKGEKFISDFLQDLNIHFIPQKTYEDLKYKSYLLFDFYIPRWNLLIEYMGSQHIKPLESFFGGLEKFKERVIRDKIKKEYASKNNIPIIYIAPEKDLEYYSDAISMSDFVDKIKALN